MIRTDSNEASELVYKSEVIKWKSRSAPSVAAGMFAMMKGARIAEIAIGLRAS